jgi:glycine/D-amino acid oxidase-like deaminating enzyme
MAKWCSAELGVQHDIPPGGVEHVKATARGVTGDDAAPSRVVIVGAGVFGVCAALELRARGHEVTLVDRGPLPNEAASSTDVSKMIRMDYGSDVFYHELAERALDGWDAWNARWGRPLYHGEGFLVLAPGRMAPGGFEYESLQLLRDRGYAPEVIDQDVLRTRYPAWHAPAYPEGYLSPRGGWAESGEVVRHLLGWTEEAGVRRADGRLEQIVSRGSRVGGVMLADGTALPAEHVVIAAGAWTPVLLPWTSELLQPVAQPVVHFGVERPEDFRGPHFPPYAADITGSGWYGFPALADGRLKLGHHGDGAVVHPDHRGTVSEAHIARARAFLSSALPGLVDAPVVETRICLYCDAIDGDFLIAADPEREGLVVASGGSGHGFKFAPVIGELVADAVEGRTNPWAHRFRWRTHAPPAAEQARFVESRDPMTPNPGADA